MSANDFSLLTRLRRLSPTRRGVLMFLAAALGAILLLRTARLPTRPEFRPAGDLAPKATQTLSTPDSDVKAEWLRLKESSKVNALSAAPLTAGTGGEFGDGTPLISHAAELTVATKEFAHSRASLEEILERHHGYASKLRMVGQPSGSTLTATLRVPSSEFNSAVTDLKTLGNVEREEQTADEITHQQADLEARLTNARNTLQRLQGALPKSGYSVDIQRQLAAVSSEITRLEAQRNSWQNRAIFANVLFSLREEIPVPVETFGMQFRKAALAGLSDALSSLSEIVLFVVGYGPAIFVWSLLLFFPGRWIWRRWRPALVPEAARPAQNT
jgi:uncharacterized small protein (DUF1192 family)